MFGDLILVTFKGDHIRHHEDVPLVEFIYTVSTRMPVGATVGDSCLCCCVPCLLSASDSQTEFVTPVAATCEPADDTSSCARVFTC